MKILLISATAFEIAPAFQQLKTNSNIGFCVTGVGMLATAVSLAKAIYQERPSVIIQAGIAGAFNESLSLGDVVMVKDEVIGDVGVEENDTWKDVFDLGFCAPDQPPFSNKRLVNHQLHHYQSLQLPIVSGCTVNQITTDSKRKLSILQQYQPDIESMEGAALHYIGNEFDIPYLQLRSISNYVCERDKTKWALKASIENLNKALLLMVNY